MVGSNPLVATTEALRWLDTVGQMIGLSMSDLNVGGLKWHYGYYMHSGLSRLRPSTGTGPCGLNMIGGLKLKGSNVHKIRIFGPN